MGKEWGERAPSWAKKGEKEREEEEKEEEEEGGSLRREELALCKTLSVFIEIN